MVWGGAGRGEGELGELLGKWWGGGVESGEPEIGWGYEWGGPGVGIRWDEVMGLGWSSPAWHRMR